MVKQNLALGFLSATTSMTRLGSYAVLTFAGLLIASHVAYADPAPNALPTGGVVTTGSATIDVSGNTMNVGQSSQNAVIDWSTFDIGQSGIVNFNQNNAAAVAVNRVHSGSPSQIFGQLNATGHVVILNSNGVLFGQGSQVNVSGLLASTGKLDGALDANAANPAILLTDINAVTGASVVNNGTVTIKNTGLAAFVAPSVVNNGIINASLGKVALASGGDKATVDLYGDGLVSMTVDNKALNGMVTNASSATLKGKTIGITASAAQGVVNSVVNLGGVVEATTASVKGNTINLGTKVKATTLTGSAKKVNVANTASINQGITLADAGGTVNVAAGTYNEAVNVNKTVTLNGANAGKSGTDTTRGAETILTKQLTISGNNAVVDGVNVNIKASYYDGFYDENGVVRINGQGNGAVLRNSIITNSTTDWNTGAGVYTYKVSNISIENNLINGSASMGVRIYGAAGTNNVTGNTVKIVSTAYPEVSGIVVYPYAAYDNFNNSAGATFNISNNTVAADYGISANTGDSYIINNNNIYDTRFGIWLGGVTYGTMTAALAGNTVTVSNPSGDAFIINNADSGVTIDLTGAANTFIGGSRGISFVSSSIHNSSFVGNTLGSTKFIGQKDYYIVFATDYYGWNPATPPWVKLDARNVSFDGFVAGRYDILQAQYDSIMSRLYHYLNDKARTFWIDFTVRAPDPVPPVIPPVTPPVTPPGPTPVAAADINDILPETQLKQTARNTSGTVTILGLPYAQITSRQDAALPFNLADIETAAGGDDNGKDGLLVNGEATELLAAADADQTTACWRDAYGVLTNAGVNMVINSDPTQLLKDEQSCGVTSSNG